MSPRVVEIVPQNGKRRDAEPETHAASARRPRFFRRFAWLFVLVGLAGNLLFFIGSICFLFQQSQELGIWLFITGSCLMLVSSSAGAIDEYSQSEPKC